MDAHQGGYEAGDADGGGDGLAGHQQGHPRDQGGGHRPGVRCRKHQQQKCRRHHCNCRYCHHCRLEIGQH